ncbi:MAG: ROK family protein [bacterium]
MKKVGIGIDVGGTYTKILACTSDGKMLKQDRFSTNPDKGPRPFIKNVAHAVLEWKKEFGRAVAGVGLGMAGDIDPEKGIIRFSPNLNRWRNVSVAAPLKRMTGVECVMENDANMAAWGAYTLELKRRYENIIAVTLGTGVGGGIILGGKLYHGSTGSAGEIGHTKIQPDGELCNCGDRGCLEAYVGSYAISRRALEALKTAPEESILFRLCRGEKRVSTMALVKAADKGDPIARRIWLETGEYLGRGLVNLGLLLNPGCIVLTGGVSRASRHFMPALRMILFRQSISTPFRKMKIVVSRSADLGSFGTALYGLEKSKRIRAEG